MSFHDHFSGHAADYAKFRPRYPDSLFADLAAACRERNQAWDCGTGSGQAAVGLAAHFSRVVATDASPRQICQAQLHPRVQYHVADERQSGLADASTNLVTAAQALHWFDAPLFFAEVQRVLQPGGIVAVWCYGLQQLGEPFDAVLRDFYKAVVGPYWPPERVLVEQGYQGIAFPFVELPPPRATMEQELSLEGLLNYVGTWSACKRFEQARGFSPLPLLERKLIAEWGDPLVPRCVTWPLSIRLGQQP